MQPVDPITNLDPATRVTLRALGLHLTFTIDPSMMMVAIFLVFVLTSCGIAMCRPGPYRLSNMRATLGLCPPSSASTASSSPPTDQGVWIALKSGVSGGTPGPRPVPHPEDSEKHTVRAQRQYWRQHKSVRSAGNPRRTVIHSLQTTPSREAGADRTAPYEQRTDHATAGPEASSSGDSGGQHEQDDQASDLRKLF